jgi:hypothetical protein
MLTDPPPGSHAAVGTTGESTWLTACRGAQGLCRAFRPGPNLAPLNGVTLAKGTAELPPEGGTSIQSPPLVLPMSLEDTMHVVRRHC